MASKYNIDIVKEFFIERGYELCEDTYFNNSQKMKYKCIKHSEFEQYISLGKLLSGRGCKYCGRERRSDSTRKSIQEVNECFEDQGLILLEDEYINRNTKMKCSCAIHSDAIFYKSYADVSGGAGCNICRKRYTLSYKEVVDLFGSKGYVLLEKHYVNSSTRMRYKCPKHPEKELFISVEKLKVGQSCPYCSKVGKVTQEDVNKTFDDIGYVLIDKYKNSKTPLRYICPHHPTKETSMTYHQARTGARCGFCVNNVKLDFDVVREEFANLGYILVDDAYINNQTPMKYICPKHPDKERYMSLGNLRQGKRCMMCSRGGENHHNWNHSITNEERENERNIEGYDEWRKSIYKKDNYKCIICKRERI